MKKAATSPDGTAGIYEKTSTKMKKFLSLEVSYQFVCYHCEKRSESEQPNQVRRFITDGLGVGLVEDSRSRGGGNDCVATCNRLGSLSGGVFVACDVATADFEPNPRSRVSAQSQRIARAELLARQSFPASRSGRQSNAPSCQCKPTAQGSCEMPVRLLPRQRLWPRVALCGTTLATAILPTS